MASDNSLVHQERGQEWRDNLQSLCRDPRTLHRGSGQMLGRLAKRRRDLHECVSPQESQTPDMPAKMTDRGLVYLNVESLRLRLPLLISTWMELSLVLDLSLSLSIYLECDIHVYIYIYIHTYIDIYIYIYIYIHTRTHTHIYIHHTTSIMLYMQ